MTDHVEAKLHGFRRTADGVVVSFVLHPQEVPKALALDPLGTRYMLAFSEIGDDEQPVTRAPAEPAEPHKDLARSMASKASFAALDESGKVVATAAMLMRDAWFQRWLVETTRADQMSPAMAKSYILDYCGVARKRDIPTTKGALEAFRKIQTSFDLWRKGYE